MPHPLVGKQAPTITLPDSEGADYTLTPGEGGKSIALFFYPKSGSFGCTKEACQFRDAIADKPAFDPAKVIVVGVSPDPVEKQKAFVAAQKLTYPILSDVSGAGRKAYNVGKGLLGLSDSTRVTFIIDKKGIVREALDSTLNYGAHSKFVEKWLARLEAEGGDADRSQTSDIAQEAQDESNAEGLVEQEN